MTLHYLANLLNEVPYVRVEQLQDVTVHRTMYAHRMLKLGFSSLPTPSSMPFPLLSPDPIYPSRSISNPMA